MQEYQYRFTTETIPEYNIYWQDQVTSTQDILHNKLRAAEIQRGTILYADSQISGRGRNGRTWHSDIKENLYFSLYDTIDLVDNRPAEPDEFKNFTKIFGIATLKALKALIKQGDFAIKEPNDIVLNGKKIAGIITDYIPKNNVIFGVGINLHDHPEFGKDDKNRLLFPASSIATELPGVIIEKEDLIKEITIKWLECKEKIASCGFKSSFYDIDVTSRQ